MKGKEMLDKVMAILGYHKNGNLADRVSAAALHFINLIYADLWPMCHNKEFKPLASLSEEFDLPAQVLYDAFPYGLAMLDAPSENDGDQQQIWASLYNQKRARLSRSESIIDVMPR